MIIDTRDQVCALLTAHARRDPVSSNPFHRFLQRPADFAPLGAALRKMLVQATVCGRILIPRALGTRSSLADAVRIASIGAAVFGQGDPGNTEINRIASALRAIGHAPEDDFPPPARAPHGANQEFGFAETIALLLADRLKGISFQTVSNGIKTSAAGQYPALASCFQGLDEYWAQHANTLIDILIGTATTPELRRRALKSLQYGLQQDPVCWLFCRLGGREQTLDRIVPSSHWESTYRGETDRVGDHP